MKCNVVLSWIVLLALETFAEPSSEQVILDRLFEQTSNAWCVAKQDFDTASSTNMLALRMLGTIESEAARGGMAFVNAEVASQHE